MPFLQGCAVVSLTLIAFIGLVWLREQILHGGGPEWLDNDLLDHANIAADAAHVANNLAANNNNVAAAAADGQEEANAEDDDDDNPDHLPAEPAAPEIEPVVDPELDDGAARELRDQVSNSITLEKGPKFSGPF